ncbi:MAG: hypothetical protein JOZ89_03230 [Gammaproteobacteria bacterium]|nr:hypothetical protein [Gammaproteobacteria bacterium]
MARDVFEVLVGTQERQVVANAQAGDERIDRARLDTAPPACIAQRRGGDVIVTVGHKKR